MYCVKLVIMLLYCDDSMSVRSQEVIGKLIAVISMSHHSSSQSDTYFDAEKNSPWVNKRMPEMVLSISLTPAPDFFT